VYFQLLFVFVSEFTHIAFKCMIMSYVIFLFLSFFFTSCYKFFVTKLTKVRSKSSLFKNIYSDIYLRIYIDAQLLHCLIRPSSHLEKKCVLAFLHVRIPF
jgi:hypothetical protein